MNEPQISDIELLFRIIIYITLEIPTLIFVSYKVFKNKNIIYIKKRRPLLIFFIVSSIYLNEIPLITQQIFLYYNNNIYATFFQNISWPFQFLSTSVIVLR